MSLVLWVAFCAMGDEFKFDPFEAWNSFGEGASVTFEIENGPKHIQVTTTLTKKAGEILTVEDAPTLDGQIKAGTPREVKKGTGDETCTKCKDHKKPDRKPDTKESLKIGEKEYECIVIEQVTFDCEGKERSTLKSWICKEVPGWLVKHEMKLPHGTRQFVCISFDPKEPSK